MYQSVSWSFQDIFAQLPPQGAIFKDTFLKFLAKREAGRVIKVGTDETAGAIKVATEALAARSGCGSLRQMD